MPPADADDFSPATSLEPGVSLALVQHELECIARSNTFLGSARHQQLLRHLVEQAVAGNKGALKETVLAHEVFRRPLSAFDPARDTIVRVEARRLRKRLARYYASEGLNAELEIHLPVGSYIPTLRRRSKAIDAPSPRVVDLVERGDYFLRQPLGKTSLDAALARFDAALRESPGHVPALVGAGRAWLNLATGWHGDPRPAAEHAAEALRRAIDLDPGHAVAHTLLGAVLHQFEYDWPAARAHFLRAIELAPRQAFCHSGFGFHLLARAEADEAEGELLLARRLDPHYVNTRLHMANLRMFQRRFADADVEIASLRDIAPDNPAPLGLAAVLAMLRGESELAVRLYQRVCELAPEHPNAYVCLAAAQAMAGDVAAADATVDAVTARFGARFLSLYTLAIVATRCKRHDRAFALLEDAIECRDPNAVMLGMDASFLDLHGDPRWTPLLASRRPSAAD